MLASFLTLHVPLQEDKVKPTPEFLAAIMKAAMDKKEHKLAYLWFKQFLLSEGVSLASLPSACLAVEVKKKNEARNLVSSISGCHSFLAVELD